MIEDSLQNQNAEGHIKRCPHDKDNSCIQISTELVRNHNISADCRMMLCYSLSNDDKTWQIKIEEIRKNLGFGRDKMYRVIQEAIKAGYIRRDESYENGLSRYSYFVSEAPIYKKSNIKKTHKRKLKRTSTHR